MENDKFLHWLIITFEDGKKKTNLYKNMKDVQRTYPNMTKDKIYYYSKRRKDSNRKNYYHKRTNNFHKNFEIRRIKSINA